VRGIDIGSIPVGDTVLTLTFENQTNPQHSTCNAASSLLPVASSLQHPSNNKVLRLSLPVSCTKQNTINQKEWHVATKRCSTESYISSHIPNRLVAGWDEMVKKKTSHASVSLRIMCKRRGGAVWKNC
jgi:hypothetical protein